MNKDKKVHGMACLVINFKRQLLILKRSPDKKLFPNKWAPVAAGPFFEKPEMLEIAKRELVDELGVNGKIIKEGEVIKEKTGGMDWLIYPFLAQIGTDVITLNEEHVDYKWIDLKELKNYETTPGLRKMIKDLL